MFTYSRKITLLMVGLSVFNALMVLVVTENNYLFSQVLILTFIAQLVLVFALGKVKAKTPSLNDDLVKNLKQEIALYKRLAHTAHDYSGNYPVWKAQQEFRDVMKEAGIDISNSYLKLERSQNLSKAEHIDFYLGRVVDAFSTEINKGAQLDFANMDMFWSEDELSEARGDYLLKVEKD